MLGSFLGCTLAWTIFMYKNTNIKVLKFDPVAYFVIYSEVNWPFKSLVPIYASGTSQGSGVSSWSRGWLPQLWLTRCSIICLGTTYIRCTALHPHSLYKYPDKPVIPVAHSVYILQQSKPTSSLFTAESTTMGREDDRVRFSCLPTLIKSSCCLWERTSLRINYIKILGLTKSW